ncbi:DUF411 domain-containing protein [Cupriavidus respiraculi]|uniref:Metal-binding protein n=1 Tax=Cupriavidus respiraculi TaxID=195930 RepID=A0ABN7YGK8_9BURK|nr:DUF411 domain-containing protein [Cupriavidus respiraculi]MBY4945433.1 DUF411 domain-containing protein [Cupriavidus respiraculi]CAG9172594.1 hypothetical protein LMG21510_02019 [Cupriavidus respiraculi]
MKRRNFLAAAGAALFAGLGTAALAQAEAAIVVYKSPTCGCCEAWVKHLRDNGFAVTVHDVEDTGVHRARLGMPDRFGSCHTGRIAGYAIEGHVPAADIRKLLAQRPKAVGLAVPGMPVGSPGMEQGPRADPFDVLLVRADGGARVFSSYNKPRG